ncbi:MAG TPA: sigma-70 family RNA polymerase sigma factor [Bacteroidia bacterium]|nr:sigma-70 family RNA polymerase sigma factor [Bacteroidia bacterium]HQF28679.1 sigma-70 family RNA polymerase sigma factor [Bacteroidia bacterium]HQK97343.1 sigma-70 family RNA polymerase sigma factor [Bacteroidia bacterium]
MQPDITLLEQCRNDNRKAHHQLYGVCFPLLYSISCRYYINKEDRMSALNMIFFRLIKNMHEYLKKKEQVEFESWLRRIAINYIIDEFRSQKRYKEVFDFRDDTPEEMHPSSEDLNQKHNEEELLGLIDKLPTVSRTVFNLYAIDGYKHEEIAQLLGISSGTSKAHLFKARKKLKELLLSVNNNSVLPNTSV